jgi:hypothetical protein
VPLTHDAPERRRWLALYMQLVLGYDALGVGLAFLPANLIMAAFSLGLGSLGLATLASIAAALGAMLLRSCGTARLRAAEAADAQS